MITEGKGPDAKARAEVKGDGAHGRALAPPSRSRRRARSLLVLQMLHHDRPCPRLFRLLPFSISSISFRPSRHETTPAEARHHSEATFRERIYFRGKFSFYSLIVSKMSFLPTRMMLYQSIPFFFKKT